MSLPSHNPTHTKAWKSLKSLAKKHGQLDMSKLFLSDPKRQDKLSVSLQGLTLDYSKNRINEEILKTLIELTKELELSKGIKQLFGGERINVTEERAVLHTALRNKANTPVMVDGKDVMPGVKKTLEKINLFSNQVIKGEFKGYSGKQITDVVNIGIGGSDLGPRMIVDSLQYYKNHLKTHFVSNIDGDHIAETLKELDRETTLFVIVSKTFTTQETLTNAETVKKWFLQHAKQGDIKHNFVAVSTNLERVAEFGIAEQYIFPMWDWVGGRYSLWSAVGLSIALALGYDRFQELLDGAYELDLHFRNEESDNNIPVLLALISIWYTNFLGSESEVVIPYAQYLTQLVPFLQQLSMESNGKSIDRNGESIDYHTGTIVWGNTGTNVQHAFMQLVHQGTRLIPVDFIGFEKSLYGNEDHHKKLMANFYAQAEALYIGKTAPEVHLELKTQGKSNRINQLLPYKVFEGNKPSNCLLFDQLTPKNLGMLIATYEHKTFVQGYIWNIYSFDQFGVELGKALANKALR